MRSKHRDDFANHFVIKVSVSGLRVLIEIFVMTLCLHATIINYAVLPKSTPQQEFHNHVKIVYTLVSIYYVQYSRAWACRIYYIVHWFKLQLQSHAQLCALTVNVDAVIWYNCLNSSKPFRMKVQWWQHNKPFDVYKLYYGNVSFWGSSIPRPPSILLLDCMIILLIVLWRYLDSHGLSAS